MALYVRTLSGSQDLGATTLTVAQIQTIAAPLVAVIPTYGEFLHEIVIDPSIPKIVDRIKTIRKLGAGEPSIVEAVTTAPIPSAKAAADIKVKMGQAVKVLDGYIWYRKHPWILPVGVAGVVLTIMGVGFGIGRLTKSCKSAPNPA
jgi:hypothetical protein